eukprot:1158439-Pelagomonas_calceolata.AAC.1
MKAFMGGMILRTAANRGPPFGRGPSGALRASLAARQTLFTHAKWHAMSHSHQVACHEPLMPSGMP